MNLCPLLTAKFFDLGNQGLIGAGNRQDHPLTGFESLGRSDTHPIAGETISGQKLDRGIALGTVIKEGYDSRALRLVLGDLAGSNLGLFHRDQSLNRCEKVAARHQD